VQGFKPFLSPINSHTEKNTDDGRAAGDLQAILSKTAPRHQCRNQQRSDELTEMSNLKEQSLQSTDLTAGFGQRLCGGDHRCGDQSTAKQER
jgi:hypothetical protein